MRKTYKKPLTATVAVPTVAIVCASQLEKTEEPASNDFEVLSRERRHRNVWGGEASSEE